MRIASVLPSATEIVAGLGAGDELVGRSSECDFPASVRTVPVLMRPRSLDQERPSAEIDRRVRETRERRESLYELDLEALARARPEVLLTQDLCGVCSVTEEEVERACRTAGVHPRVVSLSPTTLDQVWESIETVGDAVRRSDEARHLADALRTRTRGVSPPDPRPRVAVIEWLDPPILAGLWTPAIVARAGAAPVGPLPGATGQTTSWDELRREAPEIVVLSPCSFSVDRTEHELADPTLAERVRSGVGSARVVVADEAYFSRPGPRLADGVELLRALVAGAPGPFPMPVAWWSGRPRSAAA